MPERLSNLEQQKSFLQEIAKRLIAAGLKVNWSSHDFNMDPAIVVNGVCLVVPHNFGSGKVIGKFWDYEKLDVKRAIQVALNNSVIFSTYCYDVGGPSIGEQINF